MIQIPSEVDEATFVLRESGNTAAGFPVTVKLSDGEFYFSPTFWDSPSDLSLGNKKRTNIRAYDLRISFDYDASLEAGKFQDLLDALPLLFDPNYALYVTVNGTDYVEVIPTEGIEFSVEFRGQIRRGGTNTAQPSIELESKALFKKLGDFYTTLS